MTDWLTGWLQLLADLLMLSWHWLGNNGAALVAGVVLLLAVLTSAHIILHKRDARAAAAWVGLVWLVPAFGVVIYLLLGINRIQRRARLLTGGELDAVKGWPTAVDPDPGIAHWQGMNRLTAELSGWPLTAGNQVDPLEAPDALQRFLTAIDEARHSVYLSTYIFGNDAAGKPLVEALGRAHQRGVEVRVLIDGFGSWYSLPPVVWRLRRAGVPVERFLYSLAPWRMPYANLRNHRKLLVVDRNIGFMGGMNIRAGYVRQPARIRDLHFAVTGPVVGQLLHSFSADWQFACGEQLNNSYAGPASVGDMLCRGISAGPDADFDKRRLALLAAIGRADHSIRVMTPYFVPGTSLQTALQLAALRGVRVEIILPARNNLPLVHWASLHLLRWLAREGCEVYLTSAPFDHSKVMTVDGVWSLVGSGNWDARSLRLNFEYDLESYSQSLAQQLNQQMDARLKTARRLTHADLCHQGGMKRLRNALAHLLAPYL